MLTQIGGFTSGSQGLRILSGPATAPADAQGREARLTAGASGTSAARAADPVSTSFFRPAGTNQGADRAEAVKVPLLPPDPNAPAGPRPAFEASILDRAREQALAPPPLIPEPADPLDPSAAADAGSPGRIDAADGTAGLAGREDTAGPGHSYSVPPSAEARAETEVAALRRMEIPYDIATVDVTR